MKTTTTQAPAPKAGPAGFAQPRAVGAAARGHTLPDFGRDGVARTRRFQLGHHRSSWELVKTSAGWRLVPTLKRHIVAPGVNGTPALPKGAKGALPDGTRLEAKARTTWGHAVLTDLDEYMVEYDGATGPGYFLKWERLKIYPEGGFTIDTDQDGYALWRWSLVVDGRIEPPRDDVIDEFRRRLVRQKDRASQTPHLAAAERAIAQAAERSEGLVQALEAIAALRAAA